MLDIPKIKDQLHHVAKTIITGIHDVFTPYKDDKEYAISIKKIIRRKLNWQLLRMGWDFNLMKTQESIPYGSLRTAVQI